MMSNKNEPEEPRPAKLGVNNVYKDQDLPQKGIRILARMIAEAYLEEIHQKRLTEMGVRPPLYIEKIQIALDCVDLNNPKERKKLHTLIDEAIEAAELRSLTRNSPPWVVKKGGLTIKLRT